MPCDLFNALNDGGYVADKDLYANGEILFFDMYDKLETRDILRTVISDFKAYIEYNAAHFTTDEATELSMATLLNLHQIQFNRECLIVYKYESFMYA